MTAVLVQRITVVEGLEDLWGWAESIDPADGPRAAEARDQVISRLFGHLVDRTDGIVEHYRSDLYRDAQRLQKELTGPTRFWWVARTWGTTMMWPEEPGSDTCLADSLRRSQDEQASGWWVDVTVDRGRWFARFTPIDNP